jgi:hypothetical protein
MSQPNVATRRTMVLGLLVPLLIFVASLALVPLPLRPPLYGLSVFVAAILSWPATRSPEYRHRLTFLRTADGQITAANYFMFFGGLSLTVMAFTGWVLYSD